MPDKTELRRTLLAARDAIPAESRRRWDAAISARFLAWWEANPLRSLSVYWPIRSEPDLRTLYMELASRGVRMALPVVVDNGSPLRFAAWTPGDPLASDAFGVPVPASTSAIIQPEALLIPCVAFTAARIRLGYGGGFYDRTLATSPRPLAIGVGYACALAAFRHEAHDIPLDMIFTEAECLGNRPMQRP
ncbi:MAG TPA: 5-formyltetrahydrofolate cyclo-ligase [Burkholderiaceae bacterium]|nr:5-formyltetrahydrofolate cyclo-ligase [Burkholderiaceae bacterium]